MAQTATVTSYEYAAGTCTLRLVGELSPLSQVTGRPVLGRSRFSLQMVDEEADAASEAATNQAIIFEVSGREPQFSALAGLVQTYVQRHLNATALTAGGAVSQGNSALQPVGLTRHRLTLAIPPEPPKIVELSTLQLADLADALEQAEGNLQILPDAAAVKTRRVRPRLPLWVGSVAAVGIAALLGNQLLTTSPGPVVLSPDSQTTNETARQLPPSDESSVGGAPAADAPAAESVETPPTAGEALPAPATTAPVAPSAPVAPANGSTSAAPEVVPPPSAASPAPANSPAPASPAPAEPNIAASSQAESGAEAQTAGPEDAGVTAESAPANPEALQSARSGPETFDASPDQAITAAPSPALEWISALTLALRQQWRPPANLAATLRYSLTLEPDGTVTALEPLNDFSATYRNTRTLPQPGTKIPGVVRDQPSTVEVQFLPTGEVVVVPPGR
ncbi:hypothetical protein C7293_13215 [filamentous cyanobacterium CCT1]|nr:hypothetical protein C7293_13215 [filamentous cyanobacterium CCT1]PSN79304.1 hypothetical protein C8B47_12425 [filamentous cyanobacterium CCP4]